MPSVANQRAQLVNNKHIWEIPFNLDTFDEDNDSSDNEDDSDEDSNDDNDSDYNDEVKNVFPLGVLPNALTVNCNENGYYSIL